MLSDKKFNLNKVIQLLFALSFISGDDDTFSRLHLNYEHSLRNRNAIELELLYIVPTPEFHYAHSKAVVPVLEDLILLDRTTDVENFINVAAFPLNVHQSGIDESNTCNNQSIHFDQNDRNVSSSETLANNDNHQLNLPHISSTYSLTLSSLTPQPLNDSNLINNGEIKAATIDDIDNFIKMETPIIRLNHTDYDELDFDDNLSSSQKLNTTLFLEGINSENDVLNHVIVKTEEDTNKTMESIASCQSGTTSNNSFKVFKEENDLIEALLKQDVDLGFNLSYVNDEVNQTWCEDEEKWSESQNPSKVTKKEKIKNEESDTESNFNKVSLNVDIETGEHIQDSLKLDNHFLNSPRSSSSTFNFKEEIQNGSRTGISHNIENIKNINNNLTLLENEDHYNNIKSEEKNTNWDSSNNCSNNLNLNATSFFDQNSEMMIQSTVHFGYPHHAPHHRPLTLHHTQSTYGASMSDTPFRQTSSFHHQARSPLGRSISMEQRLQDIANLFNPMGVSVAEMPSYSHYSTPYYQNVSSIQPAHFTHPHILQNSTSEINGNLNHFTHNFGSAISSNMHLNNVDEQNISLSVPNKTDHDMMFYPNSPPNGNGPAEGFISSILNDNELQLIDMGNEGLCQMKISESNTTSNSSSAVGSTVTPSNFSNSSNILTSQKSHTNNGSHLNVSHECKNVCSTSDRLDASSDSAVSSMGSERVPSLSDGEWGEGGDSAQDFDQGKYDNTNNITISRTLGCEFKNTQNRPHGAQKKHQMYGKRYLQEYSPVSNMQNLQSITSSIMSPDASSHMGNNHAKYGYSTFVNDHLHSAGIPANNYDTCADAIVSKESFVPNLRQAWNLLDNNVKSHQEILTHNHTYTLPSTSTNAARLHLRSRKDRKSEHIHLTRDEKRARSLNIPILVHDIINLPMDEFNERLSKYDLNENQLSLIRDIRRRGKNKVAAQNCRKRKLDQILTLEDEVKEVRLKKEQYLSEHDLLTAERNRISNKFAALHKHIFQYLIDPEGNACSPVSYSLQQAANGSVYLLHKDTNKPIEVTVMRNKSNDDSGLNMSYNLSNSLDICERNHSSISTLCNNQCYDSLGNLTSVHSSDLHSQVQHEKNN